MTDHIITIVPAVAGWYVAGLVQAGADWSEYLLLHPIVAWEIERVEEPSNHRERNIVQHHVRPLTANGNHDHDINPYAPANPWLIKTPDGRYEKPGCFSCDNEADAIQDLKEWGSERKNPNGKEVD